MGLLDEEGVLTRDRDVRGPAFPAKPISGREAGDEFTVPISLHTGPINAVDYPLTCYRDTES